MTSTVVNYKVV